MEEQAEQDQKWWQKNNKLLMRTVLIALLAVVIVLIILIILGYILNWDWTGLIATDVTSTPQKSTSIIVYQPGKTLWDWLQLLIIPAVLAVAGYVINLTISRSEQEATKQRDITERDAAEKRAKTERGIASDNQREAALQDYIDKMSELLLDKDHPLRESAKEDEVRKVARVRTLTILPRLDANRKRSLLQFLHESGLIDKNKPIIYLRDANLSGANLYKAFLNGVNLCEVDLSGANLSEARLGIVPQKKDDEGQEDIQEADLSKANLRAANLRLANLKQVKLWSANLTEANLTGAHLEGANLRLANLTKADLRNAFFTDADLSYARLSEADLSEANLSGADLGGANLRGAKVTEEQLKQAKSLKGATMPDESSQL